MEALGLLPERASVHLDRGYDSNPTRERLEERGLVGVISEKGRLAHTQGLDPLPLGRPSFSQTMTYWRSLLGRLPWFVA